MPFLVSDLLTEAFPSADTLDGSAHPISLYLIMTPEKEKDDSPEQDVGTKQLTCGLIMPISLTDGCPPEHWQDVKSILVDCIESIDSPAFKPHLVSDGDDVGVIHKRIVHGIYTSDMVVCDVSGKNSNVMFELGMRLAFDKPTVIIKDDKTDYSFDTSIIEHIPYPRDLRFGRITSFKEKLAEKIVGTYNAASRDPEHSTFLKHFGTFKTVTLNQAEATKDEVILDMLDDIRRDLSSMRQPPDVRKSRSSHLTSDYLINILLEIKEKQPRRSVAFSEPLFQYVLQHYPEIRTHERDLSILRSKVRTACDFAVQLTAAD